MGMLANVIILMMIMSYAFYAGTTNHESSLFFGIVGVAGNTIEVFPNGTIITTESRVSGIVTNMVLMLGAIGTLGGIAVLLGKVEPVMALWGIIVIFLLSFVMLPIDVFTSAVIPLEIKLLMGAVYSIMIVLGIMDFYKGTGGLS